MESSPIEIPATPNPPQPGPLRPRWTGGQERTHLRAPHYLLLITFCTFLFGYVAISGRPLTLHEARLPQCSREMMATGNYLIPTSGGRPWLERPPLPHWIMIAVAKTIGQHADNEWSVRIPPALCGLLIVLMVAAIAAKWFGAGTGLAAGLMLATMYEFYYYSTLAEDDIFLALVVVAAIACFVRMEFFDDPGNADPDAPDPSAAVPNNVDSRLHPLGRRPWPVVAFFILLGLTNLAKGPIVGAAVVVGPIGTYIFWQRDWRRIRRYLWLWGILASVAIGLSWHVWVQHRFPEYLENLRYDFSDTTEFDNPFYYYPPTLLAVTLPWSPAALLALAMTARQAWKDRSPVLRFLWCWAIVPIIVLSLPHRRHHHYLVPSLAPWAILAALGAKSIANHMFKGTPGTRHPLFGLSVFGLPVAILLLILIAELKISGPASIAFFLILLWLACVWMFYHGLWMQNPRWLLAAIVLGVGTAYNWGQTYWPNDTIEDTQFLREVEKTVPHDQLLTINAAVGPLDFFRLQFYLRSDALLLHNLSYLRSDRIHAGGVYVLGRERDLAPLQSLGNAKLVMESKHSHREVSDRDRFALFELDFAPDLQRYPPPEVSPMQAMLRKPGPWCGAVLAEPR